MRRVSDRIDPSVQAPAEYTLPCHPATPCAAVRSVRVGWRWDMEAGAPQLKLHYAVFADLHALRLPGTRPPSFVDGLWRHTCFEAFVGAPSGTTYHEFNFAPSGEWAAYGFSAERQRDAAIEAPLAQLALMPVTVLNGDLLTLDVSLPLAALPVGTPDASWPLGLTAIIETQNGALSYWALHHPATQPDFHHRVGWTTRVPAPQAA